jgi:hypothetical protein
MKLSVPFVQLPLQFDADRLADEIHGFDHTCWRKHPQNFPGNFALPLISMNGDPDIDGINGPMRPTPYLKQCPYLSQVLQHLGAVWGRTRLMKLSGHAEVTPHADASYYWRERARVHIPIVTKPTVRFICGDAEVNMAPGECWIFDTWRNHRVINADEDARIHLVADTVGSDRFWDLVNHGKAPGARGLDAWRAERVDWTDDHHAELAYESVNVPQVMTPWELQSHLIFLLGEVAPDENLSRARDLASQLIARWKPLWAQYGTDRAGWPSYREALNVFEKSMTQIATSMRVFSGAKVLNILSPMLLDVAVADKGVELAAYEPRKPVALAPTPAPAPAALAFANVAKKRDEVFERPIFIISPPRSGSTLLFETLAQARNVFTIGQESHQLIEGIPGLNPAYRDFASNRLDADAATAEEVETLRQRFYAELRDRDGNRPAGGRIRMLEKTPKNALRVPFLAKVFPEAQFVYLHRDPRQTLSSMIEAWQSGRFRTYPKLAGWGNIPWSLLLIPGWQALSDRPLQEIVATQWETTTRTLLDDLDALPSSQCRVMRYDQFLADPEKEVGRLCESLDLEWDCSLKGALPLSRYTVSRPSSEKWRRHADLIDEVFPGIQVTAGRAEKFATR